MNFGNTSTKYEEYKTQISNDERKLYKYFHTNFGGGLSGKPLQVSSLALVKAAAKELKNAKNEFHIIRTGGVFSAKDIEESLDAGASLVQWYTGYFENFAKLGHGVYRSLYKEMVEV